MLIMKNINMSYREPIFEGAEFTADFGEITLIRGKWCWEIDFTRNN